MRSASDVEGGPNLATSRSVIAVGEVVEGAGVARSEGEVLGCVEGLLCELGHGGWVEKSNDVAAGR